MPLRRFRRQYEQLSQLERGRIIGMMKPGWSAMRVARQFGRSDCVCEEVLGPVDPRDVIYRKTRLRTPSTDQSSRPPHPCVMIGGAISCNTWSPLLLIRGPMTAQRYVYDILQPHVLPLMQSLPGATFQQDNAWPYTARESQDCLRTVTTLPWPARSPDLSPMKHI
ncbi:transposable element Tcb1 transposase [Trichonephila clavipes]|nr:transposable element Tcb1 transposase [Trichonephila clavipes]